MNVKYLTESMFWFVVFFVSTGALIYELSVKQSPILTVFWTSTYFIAFLLFFRIRNKIFSIFWHEKWYLLVCLFAMVSTVWSEYPMITLKRSVGLFCATMIGAYLGYRYKPAEIINLSITVLATGMFLSLCAIVFFPSIAIDAAIDETAWRGVFETKNVLGRSMAFLIIMICTKIAIARKASLSQLLLIGFSLWLILLSGSKTSLALVLIFTIIIIYLQQESTMSRKIKALILTVGGAVLVILVMNLEQILELMGRDLAFSGRSVLWLLSLDKLFEKSLLGYGYNAFWLGWEGSSFDIWRILNWEPPHAHNGFIDVALGIGLVGLGIFLIGYLINLKRTLSFTKTSLFPFVVSLFMLLFNFTESTFLSSKSFLWILYVAMMVYPLKDLQARTASKART